VKLCHWKAMRFRQKSHPDKYHVMVRGCFPLWWCCMHEFPLAYCSPTTVAWWKIYRCCRANHWPVRIYTLMAIV
jgi:hypothetical protein